METLPNSALVSRDSSCSGKVRASVRTGYVRNHRALEGFRRVKVDLTKEDDAATQASVDLFKIEGVPTILFLGPDGKEIKAMRTTGYIGPDEFLLLLEAYRKELNAK